MFMQKLAVGFLLGAVGDGFRVKSKRPQDQPLGGNQDVAAVFGEVLKRTQGELPAEEQEAFARTVAGLNQEKERMMGAGGEVGSQLILNPDDFAKCHLSESSCSFNDMTEATLVYTDSDNSRCWNGEPWAFLVHPGRSDKLLYYFPNGGACWEFPIFLPGAAQICLPNLFMGLQVTGYGMGVSDYSKSENGFADYTFVSPPYCTGGGHVANTTVKGVFGTGYQYDYNNNEFAINWARQNLDQTLESFVIAGSSAGAIGTMSWADHMLSTFQYQKATVIVDSYMGVFPEGSQGPTIQNFEMCNLPMFAVWKEACEAGTANVQDVFDYAIERHPTVAFAIVQPKWDLVQRAFYGAIALSYLQLDLYYTASGFYETTNTMMQRYSRHPNFVNYYVAGGWHTFLWYFYQYSATVEGENPLFGGTDGKPMLYEWVNALVNHERVQSQCKGPLRKNGGGLFWLGGTRYCDSKLYPKSLSVDR